MRASRAGEAGAGNLPGANCRRFANRGRARGHCLIRHRCYRTGHSGTGKRRGATEQAGLDANAAALWGHYTIFGAGGRETSISIVIGTGNGGGIILEGNVVKGKNGFGGELGHVLIPHQSIAGIEGMIPQCNCGRVGDLESLCSLTAIERTLLPYFLARHPGHELAGMDAHQAAKAVRGLADKGDALCKEVFRVQAHALGLFFDEMVNTFDPDALIVGGGALEASAEFQRWFLSEIRAAMPAQREEQGGIPIHVMPNGDTAGSRGAALEALAFAKQSGLA
jgi:glucokinase